MKNDLYRAWHGPPGIGKSTVMKRFAHMNIALVRIGPLTLGDRLKNIWRFLMRQPLIKSWPRHKADFSGIPQV